MISFFFLGEEMNLEQFIQPVEFRVVLEALFHFVFGTRSRLRLPSCYTRFFVVHALPARLLAELRSPMTHAQ